MVLDQLLSVYSNIKNKNTNQDPSFFRDPVFFLALGVIVLSSLIALNGDTSSQIVFGIGFTLSTLLFIYSHYRVSSYDPFLSSSLAFAVLTVGTILTVGDPNLLILGIGLVLSCLSFVYYRYRVSTGNFLYYRVFAIFLSSIGFLCAFQSFDYVVFTIVFALLTLYLLFSNYIRPLRRSYSFN